MLAYKCGKCGGTGHNRRSCGATKTPKVSTTKNPTPHSEHGTRAEEAKVEKLYNLYKNKTGDGTTLQADKEGKLGKTTVEETASRASTLNFQYEGVAVDYNTEYSCWSSGCDEEGICRCGRIYDAYVSETAVGALADFILAQVRADAGGVTPRNYWGVDDLEEASDKNNVPKFNSVDKTALEKLLVYENEILENTKKITWNIGIVNSYYGDEVEYIELENPEEVKNTLKKFLMADSEERMQQAQEAERKSHGI